MAFLRFSRDKRGVESFALVHATTNRRGKVRPRVLYLFRTPPDIKVGREPFDLAVRRALEAQNPDITFDWRAIVETPIPSADADKWRERRRAERAAKHVAAQEEAAEAANGDADVPDADETLFAPAESTVTASDGAAADGTELSSAAPSIAAAPAQPASRSGDANRKRRRRRRGGGSGGENRGGTAPANGAPAPPALVTEPSGD